MDNYDDIINLSPPQRGRRMPLYERAAQFAPYAALTGFDGLIGERARLTDKRPAVSAEEALIINDNLNILIKSRGNTAVRLSLFQPDGRKEGGAVIQKEGEVRRVDVTARELIFTDKTSVPIDNILALVITGFSCYTNYNL